MKKLIYILFTAMLMLGCSNKTSKAGGDADSLAVDSAMEAGIDKHSEAYIRQRIDTIYKTVGKPTRDSRGKEVPYIHSTFNRDSVYCSERYYALMRKALKVSDATGGILYDYDYWVCGQDVSDDWRYKVSKVYEITDSTALVDLAIHNFNDTKTTIALRFERDDWYIDDFSPSKDGNDDKKYLRDTIRRGMKTLKKAAALAGYWGWLGDDCPELLLRLEKADYGLKVTECNIYRQYGFDEATVSFDGTNLTVEEIDYDEEAMQLRKELYVSLHLNSQGDLTGECRIKHPQASREYGGPITLRKGYFKYRDGEALNASEYAE